MSQPYQINNDRDYNSSSRNNFSLGKTNIVSSISSNHSLILYDNHLFYKEQSVLQKIDTHTTTAEASPNDLLFGAPNRRTNIIFPPSYIKYRI
jgi:hypothetical protein